MLCLRYKEQKPLMHKCKYCTIPVILVMVTEQLPWQPVMLLKQNKKTHLANSTTRTASGAAICPIMGPNWCTQLQGTAQK